VAGATGPGSRESSKVIPILAILSLIARLQVATQFIAHDFRYQAALGASFHKCYPPWEILRWAGKWYHLYPKAIMHAGSIGVVTAGFGLLVLAIVKMVLANSSKSNEYLHVSARWANIQDIRKAGLMPKRPSLWQKMRGKRQEPSSGIYVGGWLVPR
jgi:type IV secretion system protein VirD4